jgi:hypothetical protein
MGRSVTGRAYKLEVSRPRTHDADTGPEPCYERYRLASPSGTVIERFYAGGAPLGEVRVTHPLAVVEAIEDSLVDAR